MKILSDAHNAPVSFSDRIAENIVRLSDAHIHLGLNAPEFSSEAERDSYILAILQKYKENGITMLRDGGDAQGISLAARPLARSLGIDYRSPARAIYRRGLYGSKIASAVSDLNDFRIFFKELLALSPDHIKIIQTGLVSFERFGEIGETAFSQKELAYMIEAAHGAGLPAMVHANGEAVYGVIEAGADSIEHGYFLSEGAIAALCERGTVWVPTLSPLANLTPETAPQLINQLPVIERTYRLHMENIAVAHSLGARIAAGSDAATLAVPHVDGLFSELAHLASAGVNFENLCEAP